MSITFYPAVNEEGKPMFRCQDSDNLECSCEACTQFMNLSNFNAADFLRWLDLYTPRLTGVIKASEIVARCKRRLWPEARNSDPGTETVQKDKLILYGRPEGYMQEKCEQMIRLCEETRAEWIAWS